jgi:hypothetical protein
MGFGRCRLPVAVATGAIAAGLVVPVSPAEAEPAWSITPTPNPAGASATIWNGVACPTANTCFAVGRSDGKAIVARRKSGTWGARFSPIVEQSALNDIACPTTTSCFAVGSKRRTPKTSKTLIEHWNGRYWSVMRTPFLDATAQLYGVDCPSRTNCTAVGSSGKNPFLAFAARWNGTRWSEMAPESPTDTSEFRAVSCPTTKACFAVGVSDDLTLLIERWNAGTWSITKKFRTGRWMTPTAGVSCTGPAFCVVVGWSEAFGQPWSAHPFALHWNGSRWNEVSTPSPPDQTSRAFDSVSCSSATSCFAVGTAGNDAVSFPSGLKTLIERWNGTSWSIVESASPSTDGNAWLHDVACPSASNCHAVGHFEPAQQGFALRSSLAEVYE